MVRHPGEVTRGAFARRVVVLAGLLAVPSSACDDSRTLDGPLATSDGDRIALSVPLSALDAASPDTLYSDLQLGLGGVDFGFVADVSAHPSGRFAVLDRPLYTIHVFDASGSRVAHFGSEGEGPGEFKTAMAVAWMGPDELLVWDHDGRLSLHDAADGSLVLEVAPPEEQDWTSAFYKGPISIYDQPFPAPDEDVTRRLISFGDRLIAHTQRSQRGLTDPVQDTTAFVVLGRDLLPGDTVARLPAAPMLPNHTTGPPRTEQAYASRPLLAAGDGWIAHGHGSRGRVVVSFRDGEDTLVVEWPAERRPVDRSVTDVYLEWQWELGYRQSGVDDRGWYHSLPRSRKEDINETILARTPFPDSTPTIMGLFGAGPCLFLAGFRPEDEYRAESLTWAVVNVPERRLARVVRVPAPGARVRTVTPEHMFATQTDTAGLHLVDRFALPAGGSLCG